MRQCDITDQDKLDELILDIRNPNRQGAVFILVEGDSDIRLFRKLFDAETCSVETIPGGKSALENGLETLLRESAYVIGIEDADFRHLDNELAPVPNLFFTDYHDIEMTLIAKDALLSALLSEYTKLPPNKHIDIRTQLMQLIAHMSLLKWINDKESLSLCFKKQDFTYLLSFNPLGFNFREYYSHLLATSYKELKKVNETEAEVFMTNAKSFDYIQDKINSLATQSFDAFQLCNGHDFMKTLAKYLRDEHQSSSLSDNSLSSSIRIACSKNLFSETRLFNSIHQWATDKQLAI